MQETAVEDGISADFDQIESPDPDRSSPTESLADSNFTSVSGSRRVVQQDVQQSRIRQRLDACRVGLEKLDLLRDKHQQIMEDMRSQLGIPNLDADHEQKLSVMDLEVCREAFLRVFGISEAKIRQIQDKETGEICPKPTRTGRGPPGNKVQSPSEPEPEEPAVPIMKCRLPSPTPSSADWSSNMSHRSSLSMDSGCLSMTSDTILCPQNFPVPRKMSADSKNPVTSPDGTILGKMRQKFFAAKLTEKLLDKKQPVRKLSASTLESRSSFYDDEGISADLMSSVIESTAAPPPPIPAPRYRKRSMTNKQPSSSNSDTQAPPTRPKSLYTYPEENTVIVEALEIQKSISQEPIIQKAPVSPTETSESRNVSKSPKPQRRSPKAVRASPRIVRSESVQMLRARVESTAPTSNSLSRSMSVVSTRAAANESSIFRASRVFINPQDNSPPTTPKSVKARKTSTPPGARRKIQPSARPQSIACDPYRTYDSNLDKSLMFQKKNKTTWEDVKRMLDPLFEERTSPKLSRQNRLSSESETGTICKFSHGSLGGPSASVFVCSSKSSPMLTPRHSFVTKDMDNGQGTNHVILSRSISSQSSDSNKSATTRRKEKQWHESEGL